MIHREKKFKFLFRDDSISVLNPVFFFFFRAAFIAFGAVYSVPPVSVAPVIYPSPQVIILVSDTKICCYQNNYVVSKDQRMMTSWIAYVAGTDENLSRRNTIFILKLLVKCVRERKDGHERK